jgi:glycosyltransferase involved in cell wall biosynthesis
MPAKSAQLLSVSILLALHEDAGIVQTSIESCLAQRYPNVEIVIVDNCSGNSGAAAARCYQPFVRVVQVPQQVGPGAEQNVGLSYATGDFVLFHGCQDLQFSDRVARDIEIANQSRADLVVSVNRWLKPGEPMLCTPEPICRRERRLLSQIANFTDAPEGWLFSMLQYGGPEPGCVLYRTSIVRALSKYVDRTQTYAGRELLFRALCRGAKVAVNPRVTSARRLEVDLCDFLPAHAEQEHRVRLALAKEYAAALQEAGLLQHGALRQALITHVIDRVYEPARERRDPGVASAALNLTAGLRT